MTHKEFVMWMKGFIEACNDLTATPYQWDKIKEVLNKVDKVDKEYTSITSANSNTTYPIDMVYKKQLLD